MLCPKCKKEIDDKSISCPFCNTKVASLCKKCGSYNVINALKCSSCNEELLKICSECGAANVPSATSCRKCGIEFLTNEEQRDLTTPIYFGPTNSQQKIKSKLIEVIKNAESKIISLCGESGLGKSLVLRAAISELKNSNIIWLLGTCTQISQLSPMGYFQDLLLTFFNINNFCPDTLQLKKNSIKFFKQDFPSLENNEILDLLNFLYPENIDRYENIYFNKIKMFTILKKIILTIVEKTKIVFIIDNFDYIDGMSYDFFKELLEDDFILTRCKFIILSANLKPAMGMLNSSKLNNDNYVNLNLAAYTPIQVELFLKQFFNFKPSKDFTNIAKKVSGGNPSIIEQMVLLNIDSKRTLQKNVNYTNPDIIIEQRLAILKQEDINAYNLLIAMSILGVKFYPAILENFENISSDEYERILEKLTQAGFIIQLNNLSFEFKCYNNWKIITNIVKNDENFEKILNNLYEIISYYKQSSIALLGYILQKLNNNEKAFEIWTLLMRQTSYIGDIGLYIIVQKQALKLIENKNSPFYQNVKKNINMRIGKLLEPIEPQTSFNYVKQAINLLEDEEVPCCIELLGYLASCAMKIGNYCGAIECIETVLNKIPEDQYLEKTLIKSRLVNLHLKLGNYGQMINNLETEILPEIEKLLSKNKKNSLLSKNELFEIWLNLYMDYTEALIMQGDNKAFDIILNLYNVLEKNNITDSIIVCRINLLFALAQTIKGDFKFSNKILDDMLKEHSLDNMNNYIVSRWNLIDIINKFFVKDYGTLHTELFNVAAFANNINDNFTKNILKTLLAKILKENNQTKRALEILEEQVAYFAKEKIATGVLLSWYLIAEIKLITKGTQFALDIATKALDIAQGVNINNYYFIVLFNKLIGEIYLAKQDFESSKVYIEKALFIAKQFDLQYLLVEIYLLCAKLYQELALPKTNNRGNYIKQALKMFQNAKNVEIVENQISLQKRIREELGILTSFCKLNGIILKKESK